ncbi:MAG: GAF domain-containing sensor histidine kinase [Roseiflexaceae bacterium]|nr:GAF domain-containing sensor histidine kinase [Roseiflexaceae bacterium]
MISTTPHADPTSPQLPGQMHRELRGGVRLSGDVLLSHGLLYGILVAYASAVYGIVVTCGGFIYWWTINPPWWFTLLALVIIVATILPVRSWLHTCIDRLVYDWHDDPYAVINELRQHLDLEPDQTPQTILPAIVATIAATLRLPYVEITAEFGSGAQTTTYGTQLTQTDPLTIPLIYRDVQIGALHTAGRRPNEPLSASDLRLLHDLARQVGITLHAARLSNALQASREQLVTAREEERRRIRRDLHDGLGPTLAALRLQLGALRHTVHDNPDEAVRILDELRADVRSATADIRRLVYDLRPPLLDEFGLVGALRNLELSTDELTRTVDAPAELPSLPAALEVAIYRIASEALHNIVRHAQATHCAINLDVDETTATLCVTDNGCGLPASYLAGIGHRSMHERATELGGSVTILPMLAGGLSIIARFPRTGAQDD